MATFTSARPVAGRVQTMLAQRAEAYAYVAALVATHRSRTFKDPATAAAVVAELGRDAAAAAEFDAAAVAFLNAVGPLLGKPAVPPSVPAGYAVTPAADGTANLTHETPPATAPAGSH